MTDSKEAFGSENVAKAKFKEFLDLVRAPCKANFLFLIEVCVELPYTFLYAATVVLALLEKTHAGFKSSTIALFHYTKAVNGPGGSIGALEAAAASHHHADCLRRSSGLDALDETISSATHPRAAAHGARALGSRGCLRTQPGPRAAAGADQ